MHNASEVVSQGQRRSPVDFRRVPKDMEGGTPEMIVEVGGNDPDR